jgi:hypothetical protein
MTAWGQGIPTGVQNKLGDGRLEKGRWGQQGFYLLAWDFADLCTGQECPLADICEYRGRRIGGKDNPKCKMQQRYLKNVMSAVVSKLHRKNEVTEEGVIKLGYHMLPLYAQLFKFKCYEYRGGHDLVYTSDKGTPKVHPVYKEIREIIKTITGVWKEIGGADTQGLDPSQVGSRSFTEALYGQTEGVSNQGGGEQSGGDSSEEGTGIDFDAYSEVPNTRPRRRKQSGRSKRRKKRTTKKKEKSPVPAYTNRKRRTTEEDEDDDSS